MPVKSRKDFQVAIICALPLEFDAVEALLDEYYDETIKRLGQRGDANWYRTGRIGEHDVVLTCLPNMGQGSASSAASSLLISFGGISLALVVGICGAVPTLPQKREIILGDVIISDSIVEYGLGKQCPDGFKPTVQVKDTIGRPNREIRSFISGLKTRSMRRQLQEELSKYLAQLQYDSETDWKYPGAIHDVLFESHYRHKHYIHTQDTACLCVRCQSRSDPVCDKALEEDCSTLGCAGPRIQRQRLSSHSAPKPLIHFGAVASADTVMKSGEHRDALAQMSKVIGFEMEGAGVGDNLTCLVIKGVSDYADSHKSKFWQNYAAATAASCVKAFLTFYAKENHEQVLVKVEQTGIVTDSPIAPSRPLCGCICHKTYRFTTPKSLYDYLGAVFVSHSGFPAMTRQCNDPYCQRPAEPSGNVTLHWHPWLSTTVLTFAFSHIPSPEMLLRMSNSIPRSAEVFKYAANGDILGLQSLFDLGKASPFDVCSVKGQSALRYAVSKNPLDVCEFLLQKQADPFLEDRTNLCAFDIAWNKIFSGKASRDMQARLQALFLKTDRLEQRGFSKLHQGILGLRHVNLEEELRFSSRTAIHQKDADGRTAVSWAAWRGDINAVELFTKYGSDVTIPSKRQIAPIHYALESGSTSVVQFLLNAGADPNHPSDEGLTPLHWLIATNDRPDLVQLLVEFGSALNCRDFTGTTPLKTAVQHNRPRSVRKLIDQGANLEEEDEEGWTALNLAIFMNRHECLKILLDAQANCEHITSDGSSILHFAAENADLKTMQSLVRHSSHLHLPIDSKRQEDGLTALELAEERTVTDEWQLMFLKLCQYT